MPNICYEDLFGDEILAGLPPFTADGLTVSVRGYEGLTPFARMGNVPALLLAFLACLPAWRAGRSVRRS
jgi:apolipoprotein N-acyltransferase